jgi:hypothetical protein
MSKILLIVTSAISGEEACLNAQEFMSEFEGFIDSYDIHGAISTDDSIYINQEYDYDNVLGSEINSYNDMLSYSLKIAKQHFFYEEMFELVRENDTRLGWVEWYGASKYCSIQSHMLSQSIFEPEEFNLLQHDLFLVDFSLDQIAHYSFDNNSLEEGKWVVILDVDL